MAISTAPPPMKRVPIIMNLEKTSPRMRRAKKAFHSSETAPSGARMTTGSDAIWKIEPRMLEVKNIAEGLINHPRSIEQRLSRTESEQPQSIGSCSR